MVSDEQIVKRIAEILESADLTTTTTSAIRRQLEQELDIDLSGRKAFVREQVDIFLQSHPQNQPEEEEAQEGEDGEPVQENNGEVDDGEEEDEEEEEEVKQKPEQDTKRLQAKIDRAKRESLQKEKKKRSGGGGFCKLCRLSPELEAVMGEKEMGRTQVVKSLWVYIRAHSLQDPGNKRKILCDDRLEAVFGTKSIDMFKMNKLLTKHIWPLDSLGGEEEPKRKKIKMEPEDDGESKTKRPKSEKKDAPDKERKAGESELPRSEVVKRMWAYIKENNLQVRVTA
ncbi:hypothetical protein GOP47_0025339 [Adiantum capillus-veneris]|uniref:Uncharacterized protein n=1 Tax=Adiantum capillus-veneris TaxID=13818 RepID=A0A9D4Z2W3_ADICA|nr:hypothetical protein GOP47_0025339 [Adiantum capillus-veneris]